MAIKLTPPPPVPGFSCLVDESGFFLGKNMDLIQPQDSKRVWIIDADDTVWEDHLHYEVLINDLIDHMTKSGVSMGRLEMRRIVDDVEKEMIPKVGWGPHGFEVSLRESVAKISKEAGIVVEEPHNIYSEVERVLCAVPHIIIDGVVETLSMLSLRGDSLVLFTQGDRSVQFGKIIRSNLFGSFANICVVQQKDKDTLTKLTSSLNLDVSNVTVVGNSLMSDVKPALECGLQAVHFKNPNSWSAVNSLVLDSGSYREISSFKDLLAV